MIFYEDTEYSQAEFTFVQGLFVKVATPPNKPRVADASTLVLRWGSVAC